MTIAGGLGRARQVFITGTNHKATNKQKAKLITSVAIGVIAGSTIKAHSEKDATKPSEKLSPKIDPLPTGNDYFMIGVRPV